MGVIRSWPSKSQSKYIKSSACIMYESLLAKGGIEIRLERARSLSSLSTELGEVERVERVGLVE